MAKPEWGIKRTCLECEAPFYDLKKKNIVCPKCGTVFDPAPPAKPKRAAPVEKRAPEPEAVKEKAGEEAPDAAEKGADGDGGKDGTPAAAGKKDADGTPKGKGKDKGESDADAEDGDDDDKDLIEDTSDLGRDDDDMSEVKEHIDSGVEDKN